MMTPSCESSPGLASWHTSVFLRWWCEVVRAANLTLTWWLPTLHSLPSDRRVGTFFGGLKPVFFAHFLTLPSSFSHWLLALVYRGLSPACGLFPAVTFFEHMGRPRREWW